MLTRLAHMPIHKRAMMSPPWPTPAEQSRSARMTCGGIVSVRPSTCTNVTSTVLSLTAPELPRSTQTIPLLKKPARKPMASGGDYIRVDFATEIEPMTLRASSLGSVTRIEFTRRSETREDSHVISAFVKVCGWRPHDGDTAGWLCPV